MNNTTKAKECKAREFLLNIERTYQLNQFGFSAIEKGSHEYMKFRLAMGLTAGGPRREEISREEDSGNEQSIMLGDIDKKVLQNLKSVGWSNFNVDICLLDKLVNKISISKVGYRSANIDVSSTQEVLGIIPRSVYNSIKLYLGIQRPWIEYPHILYSEPSAKYLTSKELSDKAFLFHRDIDSTASVKIFINLNDTQGGNHEYIERSRYSAERMVSDSFCQSVAGFHDKFEAKTAYETHLHQGRFSDTELLNIYGTNQLIKMPTLKGYAWVEDTYGLHRGTAPIRGTRKLLVISILKYAIGI